MKPSELFFYAMPIWLSAGLFSLIAAINFEYEWKFFDFTPVNPQTDAFLGIKMLGIAGGASFASSVFLFLMRRNFLRRQNRSKPAGRWLHIILPGMIAGALCLAAVFIVILGPAAITMLQQMAP